MPDATITCLAGAIKQIFQAEAKHLEDEKERRAFLVALDEIDDCPAGQLIGVSGHSGHKTKRAPSPYNLFLKKCASKKENGGQGRDFKTCTLDWKKLSPEQKRQYGPSKK